MNFILDQVPQRTAKPREHGLTMIMDKGLGVRQTEDFIESASEFIDIVKLGFGSSMITPTPLCRSTPILPSRLDPVNPSKLLGPLGQNTFKSIKISILTIFLDLIITAAYPECGEAR